MSNYTFNFQQADAVLYDMNAINQRIKSALGQMEQTVEASLAEWTGAAQQQYYVSKAAWNQSADQMTVYLDQARVTLLQISDNYGTTEQRHAQIWNDVRGG
ncbi:MULTISPECIES: WXG100 family type VII secretion target [Paractinoplanes]|jgi:WXG100 family type VII secretion target|uniref:ESAT-6-like protein n=2 Tax=Paractinoplanes TaxID=3240234 RepID=A0ABS1VHK1_9ACTN|nr:MULTISPECIES: WXG100 family type VII secretion target [Actinoplanes]MBL7253227.1 WXG100 family type VII secretion target [Actinoplanes lichenicola]MCM4078052.1 WXG100 family type VII secretion target [Actinoplanes hotanensis]